MSVDHERGGIRARKTGFSAAARPVLEPRRAPVVMLTMRLSLAGSGATMTERYVKAAFEKLKFLSAVTLLASGIVGVFAMVLMALRAAGAGTS